MQGMVWGGLMGEVKYIMTGYFYIFPLVTLYFQLSIKRRRCFFALKYPIQFQ
jgi:hypothetical protein